MVKVKIGDETRELNVGDTVNYVLPDGPNEGEVRQAKVSELKDDAGMCDLVVALTDEDDDAGGIPIKRRRSRVMVQNVDFNVNRVRRTWHF